MRRNTFVSLIAALTLLAPFACDKSSPDSAPPDAGDAPPVAEVDASDAQSGEDDATDDPVAEAPDDSPQPSEEPADDDAAPIPVATSPSGPRPVPADPAEGLTEPTNMATIRLEIKDQDGKVFKDSPKVVHWDERFRIPVDIGSRVHEVDVEVGRDGKTIDLVLGYLLDGQELVRNFRLEINPNKRELIRIEGGIALAITVGSKTIKPKPQKERDQVKAPSGSDPLEGAER
jgi:hypothetical protein